MICPDCHARLPAADAASCGGCSWTMQTRGRVPVYLSGADLRDPMFARYLENYDEIAAADLQHSIQDPAHIAVQARRIVDYLGSVRGLNVCEVGVGQGTLFRLLAQQHPARLLGVDISTEYLERLADEGFSVCVCNAENLVFDREFDVMVATDILEHVLNVGDFLFSVNRGLVAGGRFVVRVPLEENLMQHARQMGCPWRMVHLRSFTVRGLKQMLEHAGFEVEAVHRDGFQRGIPRPVYPGWLARRCSRLIDAHEDRLRRAPGLWSVVERTFLRPFEVVAVCRKTQDLTPIMSGPLMTTDAAGK
jgi:predicted TPR repeat methyltransferase